MTEAKTYVAKSDDYAEILKSFGLKYKRSGCYWQVGEITKTQGWILHLTVVLSQIFDLINTILPLLIKEGVSFKIVEDEATSEDILDGNFGLAQIGKIVKLYPENDDAALRLAKKLIELSYTYKGPRVPTDIRLGSVVYTRYGSFNPINKYNASGNIEKYIYNNEGQLVKDTYTIPFQLPKGIAWPFNSLADPILPDPPKLLNRLYKPTGILKIDPRGNVFRGLYLKSLLHVKNCVIKQGINNMSSDKAGRDIQDKLIWQNALHKELSDTVPLPKIYNLFQEEGTTILVMEFISGSSLYNKLIEMNPLSKCWQNLPLKTSSLFIKYAIEITTIISKLHKMGYVHRDIVPVNFLIGKKGNITLIDMELAYSLKQNKPYPPFKLGTPGFMSPEQESVKHPTIQEDVYGIGATLLYLFTGVFPVKFNKQNPTALVKSLSFFIDNEKIAEMIANSLHPNPKLRPTVANILLDLTTYQRTLKTSSQSLFYSSTKKLNSNDLIHTISSALKGLCNSPIVSRDDLWYSKQITIENFTAPKNKEYTISPGLSEGLSGVLYTLARVRRTGINIDPCQSGFKKSWELLESRYLNRLEELPAGLYSGASGFALALAESIGSGLMENNKVNQEIIERCLCVKTRGTNLAEGISGQGVSLLQCRHFFREPTFRAMLDKIVDELVGNQQKYGSWLTSASTQNKMNLANIWNMGYDDTGIIWFLLDYVRLFSNSEVQSAAVKALGRILKNRTSINSFYNLVASKKSYDLGDGGKGLIVTLVKAYETLHDDIYKKIAEKALLKYPSYISHHNFNQENGLASIGELYLEAWRVLKNEEWKKRADWIANVFIHTISKTENGSGYWIMEQNNPPTADLMTGNSGIIHFLARCVDPKLGYRLLQ